MKRYIIILIALVLIISLPVFASTPTQENAPAATSEDELFLDMMQLSEEELMGVEGNRDDCSGDGGTSIYNTTTIFNNTQDAKMSNFDFALYYAEQYSGALFALYIAKMLIK